MVLVHFEEYINKVICECTLNTPDFMCFNVFQYSNIFSTLIKRMHYLASEPIRINRYKYEYETFF